MVVSEWRQVLFGKGEYVIYGINGVCVVDDITSMETAKGAGEKLYYRLVPVEKSTSSILTPVDNEKVVMRNVMSRSEAEKLIESIPELNPVDVPNDKVREEIYRKAVLSCDPSEWVRMIITLTNRKQERMLQGRRITSMDERYFRQVENGLYGELSLALGCRREEVDNYVKEKLLKNLE